ncbi:MAG TPA: cyclic nucleotide-binding domain-containing protein [Thermoanaerobaculia bacterium]|nr:cyclic nucleotide-binding domain-containing protein [Thermoanaerobaculia bacterium]
MKIERRNRVVPRGRNGSRDRYRKRTRDELVTLLAPWMRIESRTKSELLIREGDEATTVFLILEGSCRITARSLRGECLQLGVRRRREILGLAPLFLASKHQTTAQLVRDSIVGRVARKDLIRLFESNSDVRLRILALLSEDLAGSHDVIRSLAAAA